MTGIQLQRDSRRAYSLLEVVLASTICATALVPAMAVLRDALQTAQAIDTRHLLLLYGVQTMEDRMPRVAALGASWGAGSANGNFGSLGFPSLRYTVSWTDSPASGGLTGQLMAITVTTYHDVNGNSVWNSNEPRVVLNTKVAKLSAYENKAGG